VGWKQWESPPSWPGEHARAQVLHDAYFVQWGRGSRGSPGSSKRRTAKRSAGALYFLLAMLLESQSRPSYSPSPEVAQVDWMYLCSASHPTASSVSSTSPVCTPV